MVENEYIALSRCNILEYIFMSAFIVPFNRSKIWNIFSNIVTSIFYLEYAAEGTVGAFYISTPEL